MFFYLLWSTDFTDFSVCLEPQTTQTDAKIIYGSCCCNLLFLRISAYSVVNPRRPSRNSNLVPRLTVVGVVLPLSSRTAAASKQKYLDYDVFPPMESNHRKAMPGAGEGLSKLGQFDMSEYELVL